MAAAFKLLLRERVCRTLYDSPSRQLFSVIGRRFSSESSSSDAPAPSYEPTTDSRRPLPVQPVSYQPKPKPPPLEENLQVSPSERQISSPDAQGSGIPDSRSWTRRELRFIKDAPVITPVSYASRVAPLPLDIEKVREDEKEIKNEELERERSRIESDRRRGVFRYAKVEDGEEENLPLPRLIKQFNHETTDQNTKKKAKVIYDLKEAIHLVKANAKKTFDETLEAHVKMTPELRRTDLKLSGFVRLPHGFGKTYRVAVFAEGAAADEAREAGADIVGGPELVENIKTGNVKVDFDKCVSTISMMEHVKKLSRNLKQLMPDKKKGTLTNDISRAVKEAKEQSVLFKKDKTAIVHVGLGKVSFAEDALRENIGAFVNALLLSKPAGLKKSSKYAGYVDSFHICSTMGQSFPISIQSLSMAADRYSRSQLQG